MRVTTDNRLPAGMDPTTRFAIEAVFRELARELNNIVPNDVFTLIDGASIAVDASFSNNFRVTLGGNRTLANPGNLRDGQRLDFRIKQDGTGGRTLAYGSKFAFPGGSAPTLSTAAGATDILRCQYDKNDDTLFCTLNGSGSGGGGSTQGLHDIWIAAGSWYGDLDASPTWVDGTAGANATKTAIWKFHQTTEQAIWTVLELPKSWDEGTITFHLKWAHGATTVNFTTVWSLRAVAVGDGDALPATYGTAQSVSDTGGITDALYSTPESAAITIAGTPQARDLVWLELRRKPGDASDTLDALAAVHGVTIQVTTNADTDA